jgi:hypothetical protein
MVFSSVRIDLVKYIISARSKIINCCSEKGESVDYDALK